MVAIQTLKEPPVSLATIACHRLQVPGYRYHLHLRSQIPVLSSDFILRIHLKEPNFLLLQAEKKKNPCTAAIFYVLGRPPPSQIRVGNPPKI